MKLNLGCGGNRLSGWENHDIDVDITKPLPFGDNSVECVLLEHVIEHITVHEAWNCLDEVYRILQPGGHVRVCFPSVFRVAYQAEKDYFDFVGKHKWGEPTLKGAVKALLFQHGHQMAWSVEAMEGVMRGIGFLSIECQKAGLSDKPCFWGVDGHAKVIGERFNALETEVVEGTK